jgi:polar amino acid transport system substrate-binding protein
MTRIRPRALSALVAFLLFLPSASPDPASAADRPIKLLLCNDDVPLSKPWRFMLLDRVSAKLGIAFEHVRLPWVRCLHELQNGAQDAAVGASYVPDREAFGVYPKDAVGQVDPRMRLSTESISLYRVRGSAVDWNGKSFSNLTEPVVVLTGASVIDHLQAMGVMVTESSAGYSAILEMVIQGRAQMAALSTESVAPIIQENQRFVEMIERAQQPLIAKPYYVMLSRQIVESAPEFAKEFWKTLADIRNSTEYKASTAQMFPDDDR